MARFLQLRCAKQAGQDLGLCYSCGGLPLGTSKIRSVMDQGAHAVARGGFGGTRQAASSPKQHPTEGLKIQGQVNSGLGMETGMCGMGVGGI